MAITRARTISRPGLIAALSIVALWTGCRRPPEPVSQAQTVRNVVLVTVDTLRADRVGAYGYQPARTPVLDTIAGRGTRFERAYATAPITLPSHASLLSGRYPAGHGARHNGIRVSPETPLLAEKLASAGFATAAFVAAFPLDRRFGLDRGFQTYNDRMPRVAGRLSNERSGEDVTGEAIRWLAELRKSAAGTGSPAPRFFLWVHLFEPHAPYRTADGRPASARYDEEIAEADRQIGRLSEALGADLPATALIVTADHGEAFGEHGEVAHSIFVYDVTLRVPLVVAGPGIARRVVETPVSLIDLAPSIVSLARLSPFDTDGIDLGPALAGGAVQARALYAESFAPLLDFGWSPLRALREAGWKVVDAPRPELYDLDRDPGETRDVSSSEAIRLAALRERTERYSPPASEPKTIEPEAAARLQALGYVGGGQRRSGTRADPKDRVELAADLARVTSGELRGSDLEAALRRILSTDPRNPQANMRLGFVLQESRRCPEGLPRFQAAIDSGMPGADAHLGRAACYVEARQFDRAAAALRDADRAEPGNPVVLANLGIVLSDQGRPTEGVPLLQRAVAIDPDFHQARFNLAIAFARDGRKTDAAREADDLLRRLPADAPQRPEVMRLLEAVR